MTFSSISFQISTLEISQLQNGLSSLLFIIPSYISFRESKNIFWNISNFMLIFSSFLCNVFTENNYFLYFDYFVIICISSSYTNNYNFLVSIPIEYLLHQRITFTKNIAVIQGITEFVKKNETTHNIIIIIVSLIASIFYCMKNQQTFFPEHLLFRMKWIWHVCICIILCMSAYTAAAEPPPLPPLIDCCE